MDELTFTLHPRQGDALCSTATEILYGGAAGGGKSYLLRVAALAWCVAIPGLQVYLFRRTRPELFKNHIDGPAGLPAMLAPWLQRGVCRMSLSNSPSVSFTASGSKVHFAYCQYEKDVFRFQGTDIHVLLIDELTQWTEDMYLFLRSRVRQSGLVVPPSERKNFPRILCGANPGGIGHNWVKAAFVDPAPPLAIMQQSPRLGGMRRQFIPARLEDNPALLQNDPGYEARLLGLGNKSLVRAMRDGDWNIVAGGMFDDLWSAEIHVVSPFRIPATWRVDRSFDWGSSRPFSVGWWAESDGADVIDDHGQRRSTRPGDLFRVAEWYGCSGRPNQGLRMTPKEIAIGILQREREMGLKVKPGPADSSIFDASSGHSIAMEMVREGVHWLPADKSPGSRKQGWLKVRTMLQNAIDEDSPGLFVFEQCRHFIRTVPSLPRSERDMDDVDTRAEDHIGDETRYRIYSRPTQLKSVSAVGLT